MRLPVVPSPSLNAAQADSTDCPVEQTKQLDIRLGMGTDGRNDWSEINFLYTTCSGPFGLSFRVSYVCIVSALFCMS